MLSRGFGYAESVLGADSVIPALIRGAPAQVLCEHGNTAEIVVVGSRGLGGIGGMLLGSVGIDGMPLGSVSQAALQHSPRPVAVVHEPPGLS